MGGPMRNGYGHKPKALAANPGGSGIIASYEAEQTG